MFKPQLMRTLLITVGSVFLALALITIFLIVFATWARAAHGPYGPAGWISQRASWCCGNEDCYPVPGRVRFDPVKGWTVEGLEGGLHLSERGFFLDPPHGVPWACQTGAIKKLRCIFLPRPKI